MGQLLLIPDPRPLDQRLGRTFFRQAPRRPGVYLMKDARNHVLYVGSRYTLLQILSLSLCEKTAILQVLSQQTPPSSMPDNHHQPYLPGLLTGQ